MTTVRAKLDDNTIILVESTVTEAGMTDVGLNDFKFSDFEKSVKELASSIKNGLAAVAPDKLTVEFGVEVGVESGKLTALLVKGSGTANLTVTLEWEREAAKVDGQ